MDALEAEKIGYVVIGMAAAVAQGVLANTMDIDLWITLAGAALHAPDQSFPQTWRHDGGQHRRVSGTPVNFVYEMTGLDDFAKERRRAVLASIHGHEVPVLSLERIVKNKKAVGRDKDKLHILHIRDFLRCRREAGPVRSRRD